MVSILPAYFEGVSDEECVSVTMDEDFNLCQESFMSTIELLQLLFSLRSFWDVPISHLTYGKGKFCHKANSVKSRLQKRSYINAPRS